MRVISTFEGTEVTKSIIEEREKEKESKYYFKSSNNFFNNKPKNLKSPKESKSCRTTGYKTKFHNSNFFSPKPKSSFSKVKAIKIHQNKVNLNIYSAKLGKVENILPSMPNSVRKVFDTISNLSNIENTSGENQNSDNFNIPLKFIIKEKFEKNNRMKIHTPNNLEGKIFRTPFLTRPTSSEMREKLEMRIPIVNTSLIKYLGEKEKISENLVNKICSKDESGLNITNKICQRKIKNTEDDRLLSSRIRLKVSENKKLILTEGLRKINEMDKDFKQIHKIGKFYELYSKPDKEFIYHERLCDFQKFWKKHKIEGTQQEIKKKFF